MPRGRYKWNEGSYFQLETVDYRPETGTLRVRYRNQDVGEAEAQALWHGRPGLPNWTRVQIDPENNGAILVPTVPGHPTIEGETAEIPGDVIRAITDVDYRALVAKEEARYAKQLGGRLSRLRKARGLSQKAAAVRAGLDAGLLEGIESGRIEVSFARATRIAEAWGGSTDDLMSRPLKTRSANHEPARSKRRSPTRSPARRTAPARSPGSRSGSTSAAPRRTA